MGILTKKGPRSLWPFFGAGILSNYHVMLFVLFWAVREVRGATWDSRLIVGVLNTARMMVRPQKSVRMIRACCTMHQGIEAF